MSAEYKSAMATFLAEQVKAREVHVTFDSGGFIVRDPAEGAKFAQLARQYGWTIHPHGVQWAYDWLGWPEDDELKAAQLAVLREQIRATYGTDEVYGFELFRVPVTLAPVEDDTSDDDDDDERDQGEVGET